MRKLVVIALFSVILGACSGVPEDKAIETMVRDNILSDGLGDLFELENFTKTNGFRESDNVYIVDIEYDLVFQKSFIDVMREIRADPTAIQSNFGQFEVGDRIHKVDKVTLHKTEKGWQLAPQSDS
jgi:hypothetical protein